MPDGQVGGGHQNSWERIGDFYQKNPKPKAADEHKPVRFRKSNINMPTNRNESECWTAGTPIKWEVLKVENDVVKIKESNVEPITDNVQGVDMLVSKDPGGNTIEYHPLITFFNEVMASILNQDKMMLNGLDTPAKAIQVWRYLQKVYGTGNKFS